ncbi:MAG: adenosine deaminase [bacterium]|nr:adenosine deaminase [bacterium]
MLIDIMPKVELHLHLQGTLAPKTILQLAKNNHLSHLLPGDTEEIISAWFHFRDFDHFFVVNKTMKKLFRSADDFTLVTVAAAQELARQHVRYAEITVTPYSFIDVLQQGLTIEMLLAGLALGKQRAKADFDIELRWVFDIPRNRAISDTFAAPKTLEYALMGRDIGVIGLGLGGNEVNSPPEPFTSIFAEAKRYGLKSLPHAGEGAGAGSVWGAINALQADRIGHGVRAIEDERLVAVLAERQIPLEVNMTSNIALGVYPNLHHHPLPALDRAGVLVTINSDDPMLIGTTLNDEYRLLMTIFGYSPADIFRLARNGYHACFAEPDVKSRLIAEFDGWIATHGHI